MGKGARLLCLLGAALLACGCPQQSPPPADAEPSADAEPGPPAEPAPPLLPGDAPASASDFAFLDKLSRPSRALAEMLGLQDPARFAAEAEPRVQVWELAGASCDEASPQCRLRLVAQLSPDDPDEARRVVQETGETALADLDHNTLTVRHRYFKGRLDLGKLHEERGLRLWPVLYRIEVRLPGAGSQGTRLGYADLALTRIFEGGCPAKPSACRSLTVQLKDLRRDRECAEDRLPPEACQDDFLVLQGGQELPVKFWLNRCAGRSLAPDACHLPGTCDPRTGKVTPAPLAAGTAERCEDRADNDCDGLADCADPDCAGAESCR